MIEACGHGTGSGTHVRALDLLRKSYMAAARGDPSWPVTMRQAQALCPAICAEVARGQRDGSVPAPSSRHWEDWLAERTGTTEKFRSDNALPATTSPSTRTTSTRRRSVSPAPRQARETAASESPLAQFSHVELAQHWAAVQGDQVPTTALAEMLNLPQRQLRRAAHHISDLLSQKPWGLRVRRGGFVSCKDLAERCEDLLWKAEDTRTARSSSRRT